MLTIKQLVVSNCQENAHVDRLISPPPTSYNWVLAFSYCVAFDITVAMNPRQLVRGDLH